MRRKIQTCPGVLYCNGTNTKVTGVSLGWAGAQVHTFAIWARYYGTTGGSSCALCAGESVVTKMPYVGVLVNKFTSGNYGSTTSGTRQHSKEWVRLLSTYNGTHMRTYVNGARASDLTLMTVAINTSVPYIGDFHGGGYPWKGPLWRGMIWDHVLTDAEIERDYFDGEIITSGLVRHWPLEVLSGGTTPELIGGTWDTVANGAINTTDLPFKARTAV